MVQSYSRLACVPSARNAELRGDDAAVGGRHECAGVLLVDV